MSDSGFPQGFPKVEAPLVNKNGLIQQVWLQVLINLWNRTGGAPGTDAVGIAKALAVKPSIISDESSERLQALENATPSEPILADLLERVKTLEAAQLTPDNFRDDFVTRLRAIEGSQLYGPNDSDDLQTRLAAVEHAIPTALTQFRAEVRDEIQAAYLLNQFPPQQLFSTPVPWTPFYSGSTGDPTVTYDIQTGTYWSFPNCTLFTGELRTDVVTGGSGNLSIAGLPLVPTGSCAITIGLASGWTTTPRTLFMGAGSPTLIALNSAVASLTLCTVAALTNAANSNRLIFSGVYFT